MCVAGDHARQGEDPQHQLDIPGRVVPKRGLLVGDEGTDIYHIWLEFLKKDDIIAQVFQGLAGQPHDVAHAHLEPQLAQLVDGPQPVVELQPGAHARVKFGVHGFVLHQIPLGPGGPECGQVLAGPLPQAQGDGHVRPVQDALNNGTEHLPGVVQVLAPRLQDHCPESRLGDGHGRVHNLVLGHAETVCTGRCP